MTDRQPLTPEAIRLLTDRLGGQAELARRLKVDKGTVWRWTQPRGVDEQGNRLEGRAPRGLYAEAVRQLMEEEETSAENIGTN